MPRRGSRLSFLATIFTRERLNTMEEELARIEYRQQCGLVEKLPWATIQRKREYLM